MKNKKAYIIYNYNEFKNDYEYINEYYNIKDLIKNENIQLKNTKAVYQFINNSIEDIRHLLNDKYIIIREEF